MQILLALSYYCAARRDETQRGKRARKNAWNQAHDARGNRVRGLWARNGRYYAQVRVHNWVGRVPLEHAETLPQALTAWQELKSKFRADKFALGDNLACLPVSRLV
jgi:hypothetical protein